MTDSSDIRPTCPCCLTKPVAIINHRYGKTYYRKKCDQCYRKKKKPLPAAWVRSGYKKKEVCEKCRFKFRHPDQASVFHLDGNVNNADWVNLKTICANCQIELAHSTMKWKPAKISADF